MQNFSTTTNTTVPAQTIPVNAQILFTLNSHSLFVGRVISTTQKAVCVHFASDSIYNRSVCVYTHQCWVPISVLVLEGDSFSYTVKKWFAHKFNGGTKIKKYFITDKSEKCFV